MNDILHAVHTERDETASSVTTDQTEKYAAEPGSGATLSQGPSGEGFRLQN